MPIDEDQKMEGGKSGRRRGGAGRRRKQKMMMMMSKMVVRAWDLLLNASDLAARGTPGSLRPEWRSLAPPPIRLQGAFPSSSGPQSICCPVPSIHDGDRVDSANDCARKSTPSCGRGVNGTHVFYSTKCR